MIQSLLQYDTPLHTKSRESNCPYIRDFWRFSPYGAKYTYPAFTNRQGLFLPLSFPFPADTPLDTLCITPKHCKTRSAWYYRINEKLFIKKIRNLALEILPMSFYKDSRNLQLSSVTSPSSDTCLLAQSGYLAFCLSPFDVYYIYCTIHRRKAEEDPIIRQDPLLWILACLW